MNVVRGVDDVMAPLHPSIQSGARAPSGPALHGAFLEIEKGDSVAEAAALILATGAPGLIVIDHAGRPVGFVLRRWVRSWPGAARLAAPRPAAPVA